MTATEFYEFVRHHDQPLSMARFGDGEAMVLNGFHDRSSMEFVFRRQLGYVPTDAAIDDIRANLVKAYTDADVIGVPIDKREGLNKYWYQATGILERFVNLRTAQIVSNDIHTDLLEAKLLDNLLYKCDHLCYISCRNLDRVFMEKFQIKTVHSFIISPEDKFSTQKSYEKHYPYQFNQIKNWIQSKPLKGCLCLVGAGVVGKVYTSWLKDAGAIALDIGCVFDMWAGLRTRGHGKGPGVKDETYKL